MNALGIPAPNSSAMRLSLIPASSWTPIEIISPLLIILVEVFQEEDLSKRISVQVVYLYVIPGSTGSGVVN